MKITDLVERIFATAVALDQSGGLKNTIYAVENEIFILNYDHTVLLRFRLRKSEAQFEHPISFKANDYDSNTFEEKDGRIIFYSENNGFKRKKICGTTDITPEEVVQLFRGYLQDSAERQTFTLPKTVLELLDDSLSHVEFSGSEGGSLMMIQRNIYSGGIIEISKDESGFFKETLTADFGPVAIKTDDFKALFSFQDVLKFSFPSPPNENYILVRGVDDNSRNFTGIVACCLYDEIIKIQEASNGREK